MALSETHLPVLDAAHRGDPAALAQLLRLCQPDIRRYAQRSCLISDVDDAVQEALLVLSRRLEAVRVLAAFSGWLFKVVQRECRRLGRVALNFDPYDEARAEQWLAAQDTAGLRADLVNALESLPVDYRQVILLRDFAEMSIAEIAAELALTVPAAKSRLHRARQMAREYLIA
ncbi:RNA polymerase sigma factor [Pseudoduganella aquatica]|jgi:RNA polymerase sigma factor (sigma-70 family)|uniref:Sigma-70 family RNA polymerase sigma factor n=1 Tax=Pseudoduganella aquatica TaxID=2660641 RepID=A0A7X4H812_9BURK|nr:sigma-70 family RNA polymerase sigma factor [Pseudoduganella aquatica]MYN05914.1 sigma-70 family RNA polymerase sigma factor [Pseudoduganella aquatica]